MGLAMTRDVVITFVTYITPIVRYMSQTNTDILVLFIATVVGNFSLTRSGIMLTFASLSTQLIGCLYALLGVFSGSV